MSRIGIVAWVAVIVIVLAVFIGMSIGNSKVLAKPIVVQSYNKVVHFDATRLDEAIGTVEKLSADYNIVSLQIMPTYNETRWGVATVSYEITGYRILIVYNGGR